MSGALQRHQLTALLQRYCGSLHTDDDLLTYVLNVFGDDSSVESDVDEVFFAIFQELSALNEAEKLRIKAAVRLIASKKVLPNTSTSTLLEGLSGGAGSGAGSSASDPLSDEIIPGFQFDEHYYLCTPMPPPAPQASSSSSSSSFKRPGRSGSLSERPPTDESHELEEIFTLLELHGISRQNTQLDAAVLEYMVDIAVSAAQEGGFEGDGEEEFGGSDACSELLLQYIPDLDRDGDAACDVGAGKGKGKGTETGTGKSRAETVLAGILSRIKALAAAKVQGQKEASLEARRTSASQAGQAYTTALGEILGDARDGSAGGAGGGQASTGSANRDAPLVTQIMETIDEDHPGLTMYVTEALAAFVLVHLARRNVDETISYLKHNCADEDGKQRLEGLREAHTRKTAEEEERRRSALKHHVLERFEEVEVLPKYDAKGQALDGKKKELVLFVNRAASDGKHTRYRDGVPVVHDGAKFIVLKDPHEDYDGGSRGKVKSKGKRGKGWS